MSYLRFIPGSEIFRRKLSVTMFDDTYSKFFITFTLIKEFHNPLTPNDQFKNSIQQLLKILNFFDCYFIVAELTEKVNVHYHVMGCLLNETVNSDDFKNKMKTQEFEILVDYIKHKIKNKIKTHFSEIFGFENEKVLDVRALTPSHDFVSYLHKDLDRLYKVTEYKEIRFIIYFKDSTKLQNLENLVNYKKLTS